MRQIELERTKTKLKGTLQDIDGRFNDLKCLFGFLPDAVLIDRQGEVDRAYKILFDVIREGSQQLEKYERGEPLW